MCQLCGCPLGWSSNSCQICVAFPGSQDLLNKHIVKIILLAHPVWVPAILSQAVILYYSAVMVREMHHPDRNKDHKRKESTLMLQKIFSPKETYSQLRDQSLHRFCLSSRWTSVLDMTQQWRRHNVHCWLPKLRLAVLGVEWVWWSWWEDTAVSSQQRHLCHQVCDIGHCRLCDLGELVPFSRHFKSNGALMAAKMPPF